MFKFIKKHWFRLLVLIVLFFIFMALTFGDGGEPFTGFFVVSLLAIGYLILAWVFRQIRSIRQLKSDKVAAELMLLKSQVNPHFFFNTLNNLYGLTVEKSDKAPEVVLKISDMMRYTIYEGQKDRVLLESEIEYLKTYIELHEMRYHKKVDIQFNHQILTEDYWVTPLLYIILLENAFKHGIESLTENAFVHISLIAGNGKVIFAIKNNFDPEEVSETPGIGLENLKRRLELLYPGKYRLSLVREENVYQAQLELEVV